ncbi:MAG: rRNA maturation RNase YbeY [Acidobacteriota bacterium]|nr:rRNA maturation RNase YbeY [Acidobacteriota bacterium]
MTQVEVTGEARYRRDVTTFTRKVLHALNRLDDFREISIAIVDDATMRTLNRKFRHKNKTTDVLTFPGEASCEIVISIDQARRQAAQEKHSIATELRFLLLHGILHGMGYDHETDKGEMNELEMEIREAVGLD